MKNKALHIDFYFSWSQIEGGQRFHLPFSSTIYRVRGTRYLMFGLLFFELKLFFAEKSPLPEITNEQVLDRQSANLRKLLERNTGLEIAVISKRLKISTNSVKQLAVRNRFVIENDMVFNEKSSQFLTT